MEKIKLLRDLKAKNGTHSPSPKNIEHVLGYNPIKYDFCFLSNPYVTDLIMDKLGRVFQSKSQLFNLLESYPVSNDYVAKIIGEFENLDSSCIVCTNGAIQAIDWLSDCNLLKRLLVPTPTFSSYYEFFNDNFVFTDRFWMCDSSSELVLLEEAERLGCDTILLINPNNPTGESLSVKALDNLVNNLNGKKLIVDESFSHFMSYYQEYKLWRSKISNPNVFFVKSMSKDFGIAGLRLGYVYTKNKEFSEKYQNRSLWNLNNFAIAFADLLTDKCFIQNYEKARLKYLKVRTKFLNDIQEFEHITIMQSEANFFLLKIDFDDIDFVYKLLLNYGVYVRTMEDKIGLGSRYLRVAVRTQSENNYLISSFKEYFKSL